MSKKYTFKKPKWLRRISSAVLDLFLAVMIGLLFSFIAEPISRAIFNGDEAMNKHFDYVIPTHLYERSENGIVFISDLDTYDENITLFFKECTDNKIDEYENFKKDKPELFHYDEASKRYVENEYDKTNNSEAGKYYKFYNQVVDYCVDTHLNDYLKKQEGYTDNLKIINRMMYLSMILSTIFGLSIIYILIPLCNKEGKTIGKMAFKLQIISKVGNSPTPLKSQIVYRQLVTVLFEYTLSMATIGFVGIPLPITIIVSMVMMFVTKYHQSFHDFVCSTILVDEDNNLSSIKADDRYEIEYFEAKEVRK